MATFTVLYTKPDNDAEAFLQEYRDDHLAIAKKFPKMTDYTTTVFSGTPRGGEPPYYLMFVGTWESMADLQGAMGDPSLMEASKHAMGMLAKYGNSAEMLIGDGLG
ncbi:MAG: EthD family reductase [Euzebya sp.]